MPGLDSARPTGDGARAEGLDPGFTVLPYRSLGDAALSRARELGATHADFRFERVRYQDVRVRDGAVQGVGDVEDLGFAVRVVHGGAWGFASGVHLTADEAVRVAETAVAVARVSAAMTTVPVEIAPEPVYDDVTWVSSYALDPFDVPVAEKAAVLVDWTQRLRRHPAVAHATADLLQVRENKYYADLAGTRTTQQRVRLMPAFTAMGADDNTGTFDDMSLDRAAGRARLGVRRRVGRRRRLGLGRRAGRGARAAGREAGLQERGGRGARPRDPSEQPLADHPRVDRPRHRARPGAGLRGQLRRHVVRHDRPARARCSTARR